MIELESCRPFHATARNLLIVQQQNVEPAIAIGVEECASGSHGFNEVLARSPRVLVQKVDSDRFGHVHEAGGGGLCGCLRGLMCGWRVLAMAAWPEEDGEQEKK